MATVEQPDASIQGVMNVTKEDQDKINRFAKLNARIEDIKDEVSTKTNELESYKDALAEIEMKELEDAADKLHLQVGDLMVNLTPDKLREYLESKMTGINASLTEAESKKESIAEEMSQLKAHLYARFGNNIHLESGP